MLLLAVCVLSLWSPATLAGGLGSVPNCMPRKTVSLKSNGGHLFREEGVLNYTTMLLREDLNLLILGAREAIFALDLDDITVKKDMVKWQVTDKQKEDCANKGKDAMNDCKNYIRILHKKDNGTMYVCGTKAFNPTCDYLSWADGKLVLQDKQEDGKGKCPFDPFQHYSSVLVDGVLYSATSVNFRGSELAMLRNSDDIIRTDATSSWLNEPNFIHMAHIPESDNNPEEDDDKIYLFFTEAAVEYDSYSKVDVSRVARVCKGDLGGLRTLQRKWTSFLKARLDCPVPNAKLPLLVQDAFHLCPGHWTNCVFYAIFTPQSDSSQSSAVCAYGVEDIRDVFSKGKFKAPATVEMSFVKWVVYTSDLPDPRPGACIDKYAISKGFTKSLELPDKTLQFIKDKHLMDQAVKPVGQRPLLVRTGAAFTRIVVATATDLNGGSHHVMFIGTVSGSVLKAVNYDGEMLIIEEIQLFDSSQPIKILRLSNTMQLYAGSDAGVVQVSVSECGRYHTCLDCVLARDPYCGWDINSDRCSTINTSHRDSSVIQSLKEGDASRCSPLDNSKPVNISFFLGNTVKLWCQPYSNLAQIDWQVNGQPIPASNTFLIVSDGLMIFNASTDDSGHYTCDSIETAARHTYRTRHVAYDLKLWAGSGTTASLHDVREKNNTLVAMVVILTLMLVGLVIWNLYKGHLPLPLPCCPRGMNKSEEDHVDSNRTEEHKLESSRNMNSNNNHASDRRCSDFKETDRLATTTGSMVQVSLGCIDDESEI